MTGWQDLSDDELIARITQHCGMPKSVAKDWVEYREAPSIKMQIDRFLSDHE